MRNRRVIHEPVARRQFSFLLFATATFVTTDAWLNCRKVASSYFHPLTLSSSSSSNPVNDLRQEAQQQGTGVGIDLGTTRSAIAYWDGTQPILVQVDNARTMPSIVSFDANGDVHVGENQPPDALVYRHVKRVIGTGGKLIDTQDGCVPFVLPASSVEGKTFKSNTLENRLYDAEHYPTLLQYRCRNVEGEASSRSSNTQVEQAPSTVSPTTVTEHILRHLVAQVPNVTRAVIGVPAYFDDMQRAATLEAAQRIGIEKVKLLREPEAAALCYQHEFFNTQEADDDEEEFVLVFDWGGGTFDVSVLVVSDGWTQIVSTSGNINLGGADLDGQIVEEWDRLLREHGAERSLPRNLLFPLAEQARIRLSNAKQVLVGLPLSRELWDETSMLSNLIIPRGTEEWEPFVNNKLETWRNETHLLHRLTRRELEVLCTDKLQELLRPVREVALIAGAWLPGDSSTSLEDVQDFQGDPESESVAKRKAKQQGGRRRARSAAQKQRKFRAEKKRLEREQRRKQQCTGDNIKVRDGISGRPLSRVVLVGGTTRMPAVSRLLERVTGLRPQRTVNPDEAVALGCAVHVGVLDGTRGTVLTPIQAAILRAVAEKEGIFDDSMDAEDETELFDFEDVKML